MKFTASEFLKPLSLIPADAEGAAAEQDGTGVDCRGFRSALVILDCGTFTATGDVLVTIQDSADNSTFADIRQFSEKDNTEDENIYVMALDLTKQARYIRAQWDVDDDTVDISAVIVLCDPIYPPASQTNAAE